MSEPVATSRKMPLAEVLAARASDETPRALAERLDVTLGFVQFVLRSHDWKYARLPTSAWCKTMAELHAAKEAFGPKQAPPAR